MKFLCFSCCLFVASILFSSCQPKDSSPIYNAANTKVIAYYTGDGLDLERYKVDQLTHIIYSFLHLKGSALSFDTEKDKLSLQRLVELKKQHPKLKVIISLGGWGGCETCSDVFSSAENRQQFATSVLAIFKEYNVDGIDLDWEYPTIAGFPGHKFSVNDKENFTALIRVLRKTLGEKYELSFAAGGFDDYLQRSVDWHAIVPLLNYINLMSYDIVNGATPHTGHHTALYSTPEQKDSTDNAVSFLLGLGVPSTKIVIGAAFYARSWVDVAQETTNGLYKSGTHVEGENYKNYQTAYSAENGFTYYWDDVAKAPTVYSLDKKQFASFDDRHSVTEKMQYIKRHKLGGIMFWELSQDDDKNSLVEAIYREKMAP